MSWDIYGEPLRRGHCEVHPYVHEEYPCSVCIADKRLSDQQGGYEHLLGLAQEHIKELEHQRDALAAHVERCQKFLEDMHMMPTDWTIMESQRIHADKPETSLARLKAKWQAEAVEWVKANPYVALSTRISELRRQAEGGEA